MKRAAADSAESQDNGKRNRTKAPVGVDVQACKYKPNLADVQNLLLRVFTTEYGENPKWVCVRGMNAVRVGVVLLLPGLDAGTVRKHVACAPTIARLLRSQGSVSMRSSGEIEHFPEGKFCVASRLLRCLLSANAKPAVNGRKQKSQGGAGTQKSSVNTSSLQKPPISTYLATQSERERSGYPSSRTISEGWVSTQAAATGEDSVPASDVCGADEDVDRRHLVALDCEMVKTASGLALARVSVVDHEGQQLMDELVKPSEEIVDYVTQYSGITCEMLKDVTTSLSDIQVRLLKLLSSRSILVGHSLENDLQVLRLVHDRIVDTSLIYPHPRGWPHRSSLAHLANHVLKRKLDRKNGHDSVADARTALDLALLKFQKGPGFGVVGGESVPLGRLLRAVQVKLSLEDDEAFEQTRSPATSSGSAWHLEACEVRSSANRELLSEQSPADEVPCSTAGTSGREVRFVVCSQYEKLCKGAADATEALAEDAICECLVAMDKRVRSILDALTPADMLVLLTGCGDGYSMLALEGGVQPADSAKADEELGEDTEAEAQERRRLRNKFRDAFGVFLAGGDVAPVLEAQLADSRPQPVPPAQVAQVQPARQLVVYDL